MSEREYLVALYSFLEFGPARTRLLVNFFGSAKEVWGAEKNRLQSVGLRPKTVTAFLQYRLSFDFKNFFDELKRFSINVLTKEDKNFPANLKEIDDAPFVLYVRGELKASDVNAVAIVGSRKMTSYGREVTQKFAGELASMGVTVVSGLAFGVDLTAHAACLEAGGRCIAVLAGGVDVITPRSNEWLGLKIIKSGGAVVSEFPPHTIPQRYFFPFRNRIISGLSKAVVVVEGAMQSGTIHTVKHAAEQGRSVFAVPGPVTSPMSQAPLYLIDNGAKMLTRTEDLLSDLDMQLKVDREGMEKVMPKDEIEIKILKIMETEPLHVDEIGRITGLTAQKISASLTVMELKGLVKGLGNGVYKKL